MVPLNLNKICNLQDIKVYEGWMRRRPFFGNTWYLILIFSFLTGWQILWLFQVFFTFSRFSMIFWSIFRFHDFSRFSRSRMNPAISSFAGVRIGKVLLLCNLSTPSSFGHLYLPSFSREIVWYLEDWRERGREWEKNIPLLTSLSFLSFPVKMYDITRGRERKRGSEIVKRKEKKEKMTSNRNTRRSETEKWRSDVKGRTM
jgi:hypothetical protein